MTDDPSGNIDSPVGESEVDPSEGRCDSFVTWFGDLDEEDCAALAEEFGGNTAIQLFWAMRMSVDRKGVESEPEYRTELGQFYGRVTRMATHYSGFAKCRAYDLYRIAARDAARKKADGEEVEKMEKPKESVAPCHTPGCPLCWVHHVRKDISAIKHAWRSAGPDAILEIRYATVPASFNTTSVTGRDGKAKNAPIVDAVTDRCKRVQVPGKEGPGVRTTKVLRVTALDAPTKDEVEKMYGDVEPLVKRIISVNITPFRRTQLPADVEVFGAEIRDVSRVAARYRKDGDEDDNENLHAHLVCRVDPNDTILETLPSGATTNRHGHVYSIMANGSSETNLKHIIEAFLGLNPFPFSVDAALCDMDKDTYGQAETFMAQVKSFDGKTRWLNSKFDDYGSKKRALQASQRATRLATDPKSADPRNFNQRQPTDSSGSQRKLKRDHELAHQEKNVAEEMGEWGVYVPLVRKHSAEIPG